MKNKLRWKDIYNENKNKRYCEVTGIKKEDVEVETNPKRVLKEKKYFIIIAVILITALVLFTFRTNLKVAFIVLAFLAATGALTFLFNYYKLSCQKDGLYIKFGLQQGLFKYDRIKSVYLSRFNDSSYLLSIRTYNLVIRYVDNYDRLKELFFDVSFASKEQIKEFLENFEVKETEDTKYRNFEKFKLLKKIGKILLIVAFIAFIGIVAYISMPPQ